MTPISCPLATRRPNLSVNALVVTIARTPCAHTLVPARAARSHAARFPANVEVAVAISGRNRPRGVQKPEGTGPQEGCAAPPALS